MEDAQIIELFFARSEDAISELDKKYGKLCHKLADNILASAQDAEECVNDAYLSTWNAIPPQRPESLPAFVGTLVRRCSITRYRANTAMKRNSHYDMCMEELETFLASPQQAMEDHYAARELAAAIERFLDTQSKENRVLFMRRYWYADSFVEIGKLLGITEGNARLRLTRMRKQLKTYLTEQEVPVCTRAFFRRHERDRREIRRRGPDLQAPRAAELLEQARQARGHGRSGRSARAQRLCRRQSRRAGRYDPLGGNVDGLAGLL